MQKSVGLMTSAGLWYGSKDQLVVDFNIPICRSYAVVFATQARLSWSWEVDYKRCHVLKISCGLAVGEMSSSAPSP